MSAAAPALAAAPSTLVLEPLSHTYTLDGQVIPGVTHSLQACGIVDYSGIPQRILDSAAERGRIVHKALEYLDAGTLDPNSVADEFRGYLQAWESFQRDTGFLVLSIESSKVHKLRRYAGTTDRTGLLEEDLALLDFKTGEVQPGHAIQLASYVNFFKQPRRFRRIALQLSSNGRYKVHEFLPSTFDEHTAVAFSAINCAHWRMKEKQG